MLLLLCPVVFSIENTLQLLSISIEAVIAQRGNSLYDSSSEAAKNSCVAAKNTNGAVCSVFCWGRMV